MRRVLHIIVNQEAGYARALAEQQQRLEKHEVEIVDLTRTEPDYRVLLDQIFAADSVAVW